MKTLWYAPITENSDDFEKLNIKLKEYECIDKEAALGLGGESDENKKIEILNDIIEICESYINNFEREKRKNDINFRKILNIQKMAVLRAYIPEEAGKPNVFNALKKIISPVFEDLRILRSDYWSELIYKGNKNIPQWIVDEENIHTYKEVLQEKTGVINYQGETDPLTCKVEITNGKCFYTENGDETKKVLSSDLIAYRPVNVESGYLLYVFSKDNVLYVSNPQHPVGPEFHHSSFLKGEPIICAGTIKVNSGKILDISISSGHYLPAKKNLLLFLKYLEKKVDLSNTTVRIHPYLLKTNAKKFLENKGYALPKDKAALFFSLAEKARGITGYSITITNENAIKKAERFNYDTVFLYLKANKINFLIYRNGNKRIETIHEEGFSEEKKEVISILKRLISNHSKNEDLTLNFHPREEDVTRKQIRIFFHILSGVAKRIINYEKEEADIQYFWLEKALNLGFDEENVNFLFEKIKKSFYFYVITNKKKFEKIFFIEYKNDFLNAVLTGEDDKVKELIANDFFNHDAFKEHLHILFNKILEKDKIEIFKIFIKEEKVNNKIQFKMSDIFLDALDFGSVEIIQYLLENNLDEILKTQEIKDLSLLQNRKEEILNFIFDNNLKLSEGKLKSLIDILFKSNNEEDRRAFSNILYGRLSNSGDQNKGDLIKLLFNKGIEKNLVYSTFPLARYFFKAALELALDDSIVYDFFLKNNPSISKFQISNVIVEKNTILLKKIILDNLSSFSSENMKELKSFLEDPSAGLSKKDKIIFKLSLYIHEREKNPNEYKRSFLFFKFGFHKKKKIEVSKNLLKELVKTDKLSDIQLEHDGEIFNGNLGNIFKEIVSLNKGAKPKGVTSRDKLKIGTIKN